MHDIPKDRVESEPPIEHTGIRKSKPKTSAAGAPAVVHSLKHVMGRSGVARGTKALLKLNQKKGFDCPSCAWPDPDDHRAVTEFCENGAKAVASETMKARCNPAFFAKHSVAEISQQSDHWMELQGRLTDPMILKEGATHYETISWDDAFALIARELTALPDPDQASFYTSGRASNEAAFLWALFSRKYGTNNLPDCSNMCHESSGFALKAAIGIGKGTVTLDDFNKAETIICIGQNPGTNHPRMLSSLQEAARNGARIVSVNPLQEAGLTGFAHPQEVIGMIGGATPLAEDFLRVKVNGDQALLQGVARALFEAEAENPGTVLDGDFIAEYTHGFEAYKEHILSIDWAEVERRSGIRREDIEDLALHIATRRRLITCWAMGLTQHPNAVATIQEVANIHLLVGALGKEGAGVCPVRGHSNVQGDRTMGICHFMPDSYFDALKEKYGFDSPREEGLDVVGTIKAMHEGKVKAFIALGGNFLQASPDTNFTAEALANCSLTAHVSTKLNRSHLVTGKTALILPCLGRSEEDVQKAGNQFVTVENSMGVVHQSNGTLTPASENLKSETAIVAGIASATLGENGKIPWASYAENYDRIRDAVEEIILGFEDFNKKVHEPGGFYLPNGVKERKFDTPEGKAVFFAHTMSSVEAGEGEFILQTLRSHDQFNTTVYGLHDRYRGISNERRIIFLNPEEMQERGIEPLQPVDITSHWKGTTRTVRHFLAIPYDQPRRSAAAYFPEANPLIPVDSIADVSHTPTSKSVRITIEPSAQES